MSKFQEFEGTPFGGGHTPESDPSSRGWRIKPGKAEEGCVHVWIMGRPGKVGCFSIVRRGGALDVAWYTYHTPKEVYEYLNGGNQEPLYNASYTETCEYPGWALTLILEMEREQAG